MRSGTYRGTGEGLHVELRVVNGADGEPETLSGDIFTGGQFVASCLCEQPQREGHRIGGPIRYRGNSRLFTGALVAEVDARGLGAFQLSVDMQGGHRDLLVGRLEWQGSFHRRLFVEIDGVAGQPYFAAYPSRTGLQTSIESAFEAAGIDTEVRVDPFTDVDGVLRTRGYSYAELHRAMGGKRDPASDPNRLNVHVFVSTFLAGRNNQGVLGVMYDFGAGDLNRRPREGVAVFGQHPLLSDPRLPESLRQREFVYTVVHEIGHALNLLHSFDKGRPASLSWMNYPQLYPLGAEAGTAHDGSREFWRQFEERFDAEELFHLRHASQREIAKGGFAFGVYEEGASTIYQGGTAAPRLTHLGANPLRQAPGVLLEARSTLAAYGAGEVAQYELGEPVFLELRVSAKTSALIPNALDPTEGFTRVTIERPNGSRVAYRPPLRVCARTPQLKLLADRPGKVSHSIPLFLAADGPVFADVGTYRVWVELTGVNGSQVVFAEPVTLRVNAPGPAVERLALALHSLPGAQEALYLRHPLVNHSEWAALEEAAAAMPAALREQHSLSAYIDYVAGLGWAQPFAPPGLRSAGANAAKARRRMNAIARHKLPPTASTRVQAMLLEPAAAPRAAGPGVTVPKLPSADIVLPPSGFFGELGLDEPPAGARPVSPFEIVVRTLKDSPAFADIVSWNIQHLHGTKKVGRVEKIAEFMLAFRCDFWALQEVGEDGVSDLVDTMNRMGDLTYEYAIVRNDPNVPATGQQNACVYRRDTTTVTVLPHSKLFDGSIQVENTDGTSKKKRIFDRRPLLCDVRVRQSSKRAFDFRCAVVHLKSTDPKLKDKGNATRAASARAIAKWVALERDAGIERDFLVMGDMNAETAQQGLAPFAKDAGLTLLSLGMREKHGKGDDGAITRFASGRLLDHIVVSSDTMALMPESDEDEQIIVRSDIEIEAFGNRLSEGAFAQYEYSDHLPVAVRFVIGKDSD